jgi:transglutaminase-like putative cysteine protease
LRFLPILFLTAAFCSCAPKIPRIDSIDPKIGGPGEILTIRGENFGREREESHVTIAGISPTNSSYINWQNDQITIRAPELGESGLVYVHVKNKKSNGALFSNQAGLPSPVQGEHIGMGPRIISVSPLSGQIGSIVSITGNNFGSSRERSGVYFQWEGINFPSAPIEAKSQEFTEVSETEFGYELWNEREIRIRVPDGAVSGNMEVRTIRGNSRPFYFDVSGKPGTKTYGDRRSFTIRYSVNIKTREASGNNTLYLWVPQPAVSASQKNRELLSRNLEPFIENYRGASLFKLNDLVSNSDVHIDLSYKVEVYAIETNIRPQAIRQEENTAVNSIYTQADSLIPSDNPRIINQAGVLTGRERNPYIKAQRIYEWFINEGVIKEALESGTNSIWQAEEMHGSPVEALSTKRADPYTAALLFCALARAAGVPCIPVSGVLINRGRQTLRHYWVEFWIDGFGWIPADPAMGAGAVPVFFRTRQDMARYYFGNIDSQRIAFSRGQANLSQMEQRGRAISRVRSYALQNIWEEVVGGLDSYSSLWGDITVTGIYAQ